MVKQQRLLLANITEALHNCNQSIQWIREQRNSLWNQSCANLYHYPFAAADRQDVHYYGCAGMESYLIQNVLWNILKQWCTMRTGKIQ